MRSSFLVPPAPQARRGFHGLQIVPLGAAIPAFNSSPNITMRAQQHLLSGNTGGEHYRSMSRHDVTRSMAAKDRPRSTSARGPRPGFSVFLGLL